MLTKAQTLVSLISKVTKSYVCDSIVFTVDDWKKSKEEVIQNIQSKFDCNNLIIRSSALNEDGSSSSMAGAYDSVKNVNSKDNKKLTSGINYVIKSYGKNCLLNNEILIQSMVEDVSMSGVVFTHELNHGSPYYVINYDDISGLTDTVTSGDGEYSNRTLYIYRNSLNDIRSNRIKNLIAAVQEVEQIMKSDFLDIEFAIDNKFTIYILQVRAITTQPNWNRSIVNNIDSALIGIKALIKRKFKPIDGIYGDSTVFGQMPDWNPAEMIGRVPHALAFSLYEKLITNHSWRKARKKMGYAVPEGQPLMVSLAGQPFIDTRLSFHSYLPSNLNPKIGNKLVNYWLKKLKDHPELHDKIEFDIAITTYSFDFDDKLENLIGDFLNKSEKMELKKVFLNQTLSLLSDKSEGSIKAAVSKINLLSEKQERFYKNSLNFDQLFLLIDECINLGTIPFSILARHGFIAKTFLLSFVNSGILSKNDFQQIMASMTTIASEMVEDLNLLQKNKIDRNTFMYKYGHLRPGTYDIISLRYDQMTDFDQLDFAYNKKNEKSNFKLKSSQKKLIDELLYSHGFKNMDCDFIFKYIEEAISGREFAKFIFTRSVSNILEIIANFGEDHFLSREELSHIPINDFLYILKNSSKDNIENRLRKISKINQQKNNISSAIRLPQILFDTSGVYVVPFQVSQPNFITRKRITAKSIMINTDISSINLNGKIVLIENADPGYDWIFSQKISGLITKYGGANSHMAIRCAEFIIPAAIGCGEQRYDSLIKANQIMLDCSGSLIKVVE